jgi:hypothetical protein
VDVIRGVPDRDPAHRLVVTVTGQTGPVHDLFRDLYPLGIGEKRITRSGPDNAMPYRLVEPAPPERGQRLIQ